MLKDKQMCVSTCYTFIGPVSQNCTSSCAKTVPVMAARAGGCSCLYSFIPACDAFFRKAQCKQCQMECELLGQEFTTCLQSCRYPQNLQKSMLDRQGVAIADCQGLQASFLTLEQSGSHLHQNKVASSIFKNCVD